MTPLIEALRHSALSAQPAVPCLPWDCHAKILVMDDEDLICGVLVNMLTPYGFSVATAPGGQEALAMYQQAMAAGAPFDVVIMDLTIPGGIGGRKRLRTCWRLILTPRPLFPVATLTLRSCSTTPTMGSRALPPSPTPQTNY